MKPLTEDETLWAILSALTETKLTTDEFLDLAESKTARKLLDNPIDLVRYLDSWHLDSCDYPVGPNLPHQRTGGGPNGEHKREMKPDEIKKWNDMIDGWEREIIDLKRTQDAGKKKKINKLKNKIKDAKETIKARGEQHSQRDKGYTIPGFHEAEGLDDDEK